MAIDTSRLTATCDPYVFIESRRKGYVRYVEVISGRRWEVSGECTRIGKCWEGCADPQARARNETLGLDCPVAPGFNSSGCCQFNFVELPSAEV